MIKLIGKTQTRKLGERFLYLFLLFLLILTPGKLNAQQLTGERVLKITGKVLDETGEPVIGGNVVQKGTSNGTVTNMDGDFSFDVPQGATITISYLGYLTEEIVVKDSNPLFIHLREDVQKLSEVVVIGYGTRERKNLTGAIDAVGSSAIENRPVGNTMQALQGLSPNLTIQQRNMNPNDNSMNLNVRGVSTMNNNDPLIVIDGLISGTATLNNLNPNDIENVSVLKDAGSAAIYGSRSSNGVILVTTKQGTKSGKPVVKFSGLVGYEHADILFRPVKGYENALLTNQAYMNSGQNPIFTPEQIRDLYDHQSEEYWYFDKIIQKAPQQTYNMSISGGNANSTYMVSAGYYNQGSNYIGSFGLERYNFRTNLSTEYGRFKLTSMMAYNRRMDRTVAGGTGNVIINSTRIPPYYYYKFQEDGKWLTNNVVNDDNTMAKLLEGGYERKDEDNFIGSLSPELKILEGLKARGLIGLDLTQHHRYRRFIQVPLYANVDADQPTNFISPDRITDDYNEKRYTLSTQAMLDFDRTFNADHHVTGLLGASNESYTRENATAGWRYTDPDLGLPVSKEGQAVNPDVSTTNANTDQTSITSLFGRAGYSYKNKYYGDFAFRYDGSSKFDKDHRWGFFPSFSAGWRLSEEGFLESYRDAVGDLKIRGSYGILGNQNVGSYAYQTTYQIFADSYVFNNVSVPGTGYNYGNSLLEWEKSATTNIGLDATFLKNKLYVALDYFSKNTSGILLTPVVPSAFGSNAPNQNLGEMQNQGWEATVSYRTRSGSFTHDLSLNVADTKNKVIDFDGKEQISQNDQLYKIIREGEALGSYYGYKVDGYFQSYEEIAGSALPIGANVQPGDVKYVDIDESGVIDDKDRVILGNAFPRYTFGFTYNLTYKGFDLGMLLQGVGKRDMFVRGELIEPFHSNYSYAIYRHQLDFWTPTNPDARWPRLVAPGSASQANNWGKAGNGIYLLDGAYLRLKNIQVGYTLPRSLTAKLGIQKLRVSLNAQNLLTLSKNAFIDPESSEFGSNMGGTGGVGANSARNYPSLIYYGCGLELEF
ncbi:MAG: TonB-dependent receptor [Tannerella sp.]|jgi:TonB-linked SusC/RagA family outer membrane protein|nr:TonB-dependent receptor [Tannerella sp.]